MQSHLQKIVVQRLEELGLGPVEAATRAGIERTYIRDIVEGRKRTVRSDKIDALARALQLDPSDLANQVATPSTDSMVPLMGRVGAGAEIEPDYEQVPEAGLEQITLPFPVPADMIAFRVEGDSMLPQFQDGMIIVVYREQRRPLDTFFGETAVVRTADGRRFVKTIMKADRNRVTLVSWNARPIENVRLAWIGEIFTYFPEKAFRHAAKVGGLQGKLNFKAA